MKVYVAARLSNIETAKRVINALRDAGHEITYDWTTHGSVNGQGPVRYREIADAELCGVLDAEIVVALLPGGFGTHCEIGAALATGKRVLIVGDHDGAYPCAFHYHGLVQRLSSADTAPPDGPSWETVIADALTAMDNASPVDAPSEAERASG